MSELQTTDNAKHSKKISQRRGNFSVGKDYFSPDSSRFGASYQDNRAVPDRESLRKYLRISERRPSSDGVMKGGRLSENDEMRSEAGRSLSDLSETRHRSGSNASFSFVTKYAKVTPIKCGTQKSLKNNWKSDSSKLKEFDDLPPAIHKKDSDEGSSFEIPHDESSHKNFSLEFPKDRDLLDKKIDTSVRPDSSSGDEDPEQELRSASMIEASRLDFDETPRVTVDGRQKNSFFSLLGQDVGMWGDKSCDILCSQIEDRTTDKQLFSHDSDEISIIENSQPKVDQGKPMSKLSDDRRNNDNMKGGLYIKTTPLLSESKTMEELLLTDRDEHSTCFQKAFRSVPFYPFQVGAIGKEKSSRNSSCLRQFENNLSFSAESDKLKVCEYAGGKRSSLSRQAGTGPRRPPWESSQLLGDESERKRESLSKFLSSIGARDRGRPNNPSKFESHSDRRSHTPSYKGYTIVDIASSQANDLKEQENLSHRKLSHKKCFESKTEIGFQSPHRNRLENVKLQNSAITDKLKLTKANLIKNEYKQDTYLKRHRNADLTKPPLGYRPSGEPDGVSAVIEADAPNNMRGPAPRVGGSRNSDPAVLDGLSHGAGFRPIVKDGSSCWAPSSVGSTDPSSKTELGPIFDRSGGNKSFSLCRSGDLENGTVVPFSSVTTPRAPRNQSKFIDSVAQRVTTSSFKSKPISGGDIVIVDGSDTSIDGNGVKAQNLVDKVGSDSFRENTKVSVPESSVSTGSTFFSPATKEEEVLNFTRIIGTDANNNTLPGKKKSNKEASPSLLALIRPTKTYIKKQTDRPDHTWFQEHKYNLKGRTNNTCLNRVNKKKLFFLPSSYQASFSNDSQPKDEPLRLAHENKRQKRIDNRQAPTIFDFEDSKENFKEEPLTRFVGAKYSRKHDLGTCFLRSSNDGLCLRRSARNMKKINYMELSDGDIDNRLKVGKETKLLSKSEKDNDSEIILNGAKQIGRSLKASKPSPSRLPSDSAKVRSERSASHMACHKTVIENMPKSVKKSKGESKPLTDEIGFDLDEVLRKETACESKDIMVINAKKLVGIEKNRNPLSNGSENLHGRSSDLARKSDKNGGRRQKETDEHLVMSPEILPVKKKQGIDTKICQSRVEDEESESGSAALKRSKSPATGVESKKNKMDSTTSDYIDSRSEALKIPRPSSAGSLNMETIRVEVDVHPRKLPRFVGVEKKTIIDSVVEEDLFHSQIYDKECETINKKPCSEEREVNNNVMSLLNSIQDGIKQVDRNVQKLFEEFLKPEPGN